MLPNSVWVIKFGALGAGGRERKRLPNKQTRHGSYTYSAYLYFILKISTIKEFISFHGEHRCDWEGGDLVDVRIGCTAEDLWSEWVNETFVK